MERKSDIMPDEIEAPPEAEPQVRTGGNTQSAHAECSSATEEIAALQTQVAELTEQIKRLREGGA